MMRVPPHYDASTPELCFNACMFFECAQHKLSARESSGWCSDVDDRCTPKTCKLAQCQKGKLLPNGTCIYCEGKGCRSETDTGVETDPGTAETCPEDQRTRTILEARERND